MPEQDDRLIEGSRLVHSRLCVQYLNIPVAPSVFDRLIPASGYRHTQTALLGDPPSVPLLA